MFIVLFSVIIHGIDKRKESNENPWNKNNNKIEEKRIITESKSRVIVPIIQFQFARKKTLFQCSKQYGIMECLLLQIRIGMNETSDSMRYKDEMIAYCKMKSTDAHIISTRFCVLWFFSLFSVPCTLHTSSLFLWVLFRSHNVFLTDPTWCN